MCEWHLGITCMGIIFLQVTCFFWLRVFANPDKVCTFAYEKYNNANKLFVFSICIYACLPVSLKSNSNTGRQYFKQKKNIYKKTWNGDNMISFDICIMPNLTLIVFKNEYLMRHIKYSTGILKWSREIVYKEGDLHRRMLTNFFLFKASFTRILQIFNTHQD